MKVPLRTVAVILGGGIGERVGLPIPKQLIKIGGRPIIEHTLAAFNSCDFIDEIIVMMASGYLDAIRDIVDTGPYGKVSRILPGSDTRNGTTYRALEALGTEECNILLHDAVRPLVTERIISDCVAALIHHEAVDTAIPSADTVIQVRANTQLIDDVLPRPLLRRGQTPQGFRASVLRRAYDLAMNDSGFSATDDCTVVLRYLPDVPIVVIPGDDRNMKITEPIDVYLADRLLQLNSNDLPLSRPDADYRRSLAGKVVVIFGGAYGIGADIAAAAAEYGAKIRSFSRSTTGTHVEKREDIVRACDQVLDEDGQIDYVVNAAGVLPRGRLTDASDETISLATEINYIAPILIAQTFYPHLSATGGSLLLFTSSSYTRGRAGYSLYSSAKAAIVNLTQALADEWSESGVRVNCINPERTATPMRTKAFGTEPSGSLLESKTVALASIDTMLSSLTGHIIDVRKADPLRSLAMAADTE